MILDDYNVSKIFYSKHSDISKLNIEMDDRWISLQAFDNLKILDINIQVLGPLGSYDNENANSLVLKINIMNQSFLFTGDIDIEVEADLIIKYGDLLKSDVLKVAHHGSDTSSSNEFINHVDSSYFIISVSENNKYDLPSKSVVDYVSSSGKLYMTKANGNICFIIKKDKMSVKVHKKMAKKVN